MPQISKDKMQVTPMRLRLLFLMSFTSFLLVLTIPIMHRNSNFEVLEGFSKEMIVEDTTQKVTIESLIGGPVPNVTIDEFESEEMIQEITHDHSRGRSKGDNILTSSKNDDTVKLLNGLLVSEFDEASCISRVQSHLYRKVSSHKPSQYLQSKLRNYEELHRRCGPNSKAFKREMIKLANSKNNKSTTTMCKYIIWSNSNGLGNQIISMASTFLYALLTNRVMLVNFGKDKHNLFCEPFLNSTWLLPKNYHFGHVRTFQSMVYKDLSFPMPSILYVDLTYHHTFPERYFHCDHSQARLNKVPLLILTADQYFVPSLFMTTIFAKELNKMFTELDTVFHHLGRYLFHPSNDAWRQITNFYQENLAKADEKIGLQIRVYEWSTTPQQLFMDQVLNCTIHNKILPQVGMQNSVYSSSGNINNQTVVKVVLVASLSPEYGADLRAMYVDKPTVTGEVIEVYQPSHEESQKFDDNEHNMKAWVEMYLLSLADVLVTTYYSTFGYVARGLGNSKAWFLHRPKYDDEVPFPACEQDLLLEPCYHARPYHHCNGDFIKDLNYAFPYLRQCRDYSSGVKLNNGSTYM